MKFPLLIIATIGFPIVTYLAIILHFPALALIYFGLLVGAMIVNSLFHSKPLLMLLILIALVALIVISIMRQDINLILLPPILISGAMFYGFASSLVKRAPVITKFVKLIYNKPLTPALERYTYHCTVFWTIITGLVFVETICLAAFAPLYIWSLFCNILNYIFFAVCFIAEYGYRYSRFGALIPLNLYIKKLFSTDWKKLLRS